MAEELVKIKGDNNKIVLFLDEKQPFEKVSNALFSILQEAMPVLTSNTIIINLGKREGLNPYLDNIIRKFKSLNINLEKIIIETGTNSSDIYPIQDLSKRVDSSVTILRKTVRSGQKVSNEGDVIVFGDVNPGGEVSATGNITVLGDIRGVVHAGVKGNTSSYVVAYNLKPLQIRIGPYMIRGEDMIKKIGKEFKDKVKIIYIDSGEFRITSDFSIVREVTNGS